LRQLGGLPPAEHDAESTGAVDGMPAEMPADDETEDTTTDDMTEEDLTSDNAF
jgi:hypothetical protein